MSRRGYYPTMWYPNVDNRSPQEVEESILSTPTVIWDPFTVLPKEIYLKIFNKLENQNDKVNFMNAHVKFYDLFKSERVTFLFEGIFRALSAREDRKNRRIDYYSLRLRLVCRGWDQSIKNYFQLHPSNFVLGYSECYCRHSKKYEQLGQCLPDNRMEAVYKRLRFKFSNSNPQYLEQLIASYPPSRTPIFMRKFRFFFAGKLEERRNLRSQADTLINTYGINIWHISFRFYNEFSQETYAQLLKWLHLMPELRTLKIKCGYFNNPVYEQPFVWTALNDENNQDPELGNLQNLHVYNFPEFAYNKLVSGAKALRRVKVDFDHKINIYLKEHQLPVQLTEACLTLKGLVDFEYLKSLEQFQLLRKLALNLAFEKEEEIPEHGHGHYPGRSLYYCSYSYSIWPEWEMILNMIEEKFPALEELDLTLPMARQDEDKRKALEQSKECRLNLTKLKRLRIVIPNLCSLNFIKELIEGLDELQILKEHFNESAEDIQRNEKEQGYLSLYGFPKLKKYSYMRYRGQGGGGTYKGYPCRG